MKRDSQGRITNITKSDQPIKIKDNVRIYGGHSVCNSCGKDMPTCWDTVCYVCGNTSCYKCSYSYGNHWYCKNHSPIMGIASIVKFIKYIKQLFNEPCDITISTPFSPAFEDRYLSLVISLKSSRWNYDFPISKEDVEFIDQEILDGENIYGRFKKFIHWIKKREEENA